LAERKINVSFFSHIIVTEEYEDEDGNRSKSVSDIRFVEYRSIRDSQFEDDVIFKNRIIPKDGTNVNALDPAMKPIKMELKSGQPIKQIDQEPLKTIDLLTFEKPKTNRLLLILTITIPSMLVIAVSALWWKRRRSTEKTT
jgi:hypothetical protein